MRLATLPTREAWLRFYTPRMVARMRRLGILVLCLAATAVPWAGAGGVELDGTWVASLGDGSEFVWQVDGSRLRLNGRPADLEVRNDSLIVRFDLGPKTPPEAERETAVYRFVAGSSQHGFQRLFVYGFDLGSNGVYFEREAATEAALPEDAAPSVPQPPEPPRKPGLSPPTNGGSSPAPVAQAHPSKR